MRKAAVHLLRFAWACALGATCGAEEAAENAPVLPLRTIHVPYSELPLLLGSSPKGIMIGRDEYDRLFDRATREAAETPPATGLITAADYHVTLGDGPGFLTGTLTLAGLKPGMTVVDLPFADVRVLTLTADGAPAPMRKAENGAIRVLLRSPGMCSLRLEGLVPVVTEAARRTLAFAVPPGASGSLRITAPGDVEVKSGATPVSRTFSAEREETVLEILPQRTPYRITLSGNNRQRRADRIVLARSVLFAEVTQAYRRLHATVSLEIPHGAVTECRFEVPEGYEMTEVSAPEVSSWQQTAEADGTQILTVRLRDEVAGRLVLNATGVRCEPPFGDWLFPVLRPLDTVSHSAVLGILPETRLRTDTLLSENAIPIGTEILTGVLPRDLLAGTPGAPALKAAAAFYAADDTFAIRATFSKPPAEFETRSALLLSVTEGDLSLEAVIGITPRYEKLFEVPLAIPPEWSVEALTDDRGNPVTFEPGQGPPGMRTIRLRIPEGIAPDSELRFTLTARRPPPGDLGADAARTVAFPVPVIAGAARAEGAVAVLALDDLTVEPLRTEALTPLDKNERREYGLTEDDRAIAYRFSSVPFALDLSIASREAAVTAETFSFYTVEPDVVSCRYEVIYDIRRGRIPSLTFALPLNTPTAISVTGIGACRIREFAATDGETERVWQAYPTEAGRGRVALAVEFRQPYGTGDAEAPVLPPIRIPQASLVSGRIAVEGDAELDVRLTRHPRRIDAGELAEAAYRPGRRLLGAFSHVGDPPPLGVRVVRHEGYPLPPVLADRAELASTVAAAGGIQTSARYLLQTRAPAVEVALPEGAVLWSILLDGEPVAPKEDGGKLLVDFPEGTQPRTEGTRIPRDLTVVYETEGTPFRLYGKAALEAPRLFVREDASRTPVACIDLVWHLYAPQGYRVLATAGTLAPTDRERPVPAAVTLGRILYALSGGVNLRHGLLGATLSAAAREVASVQTRADMAPAEGYDYDGEATPGQQAGLAGGEPRGEDAFFGRSSGMQEEAKAKTEERDRAKTRAVWALEGARSLKIELTGTGPARTFLSLGNEPRLVVSLGLAGSADALAFAVAAAVFTGGLLAARRGTAGKAAYVLIVLAAASLLAAMPGPDVLTRALNGAFCAALALAAYFPAAAILRSIGRRLSGCIDWQGIPSRSVLGLVLAAAVALPAGTRAADAARRTEIPHPVELVEPKTIPLPPDALIVPTGDEAPPDTVVVPYEHYLRLRNRVKSASATSEHPPLPYVLGPTTCETELNTGEYLEIRGVFSLEVLEDGPVEIPFPIGGAVLLEATVNGEPARLSLATPAPQADPPAQRAAPNLEPLPVFCTTGKGPRDIRFRLRTVPDVRGGWRVADVLLPAAPAAAVDMAVPRAGTEVVFGIGNSVHTHTTAGDGETLRTGLDADGHLRVRWRPKVLEGEIDRSLTAESAVVWDLREDRLDLVWTVSLAFRRGERDVFTVALPRSYRIDAVEGTNVRGWTAEETNGTATATIVALRPAKDSEQFTVRAWTPGVGPAAADRELRFPALAVPDAVRHTGTLVVRQSPLLELRTSQTGPGLRRIENDPQTAAIPPGTDRSPLGLRTYEAYQAGVMPPELTFQVRAMPADIKTDVKTIFRIAGRRQTVESRVGLAVRKRPLFALRIALPDGFEPERLTGTGVTDWVVDADGAGITVRFADGLRGDAALALRAEADAAGPGAYPVPQVALPDFPEAEGELVIQCDPGSDVSVTASVGLERALLRTAHAWLAPAQRDFARLAFRGRPAASSGTVELRRKAANVTCRSIANARITDRAVEETLLLSYDIRGGGIRTVEFVLPEHLGDAEISAPLVRRTSLTPLPDAAGHRVRLDLQGDVTGEFRVLAEGRRPLTEDEFTVTPAITATGRSERVYIAVESAGRDEVLVSATRGLEAVSRQAKEWADVADLFRGGSTQLFTAVAGEEAPALTFAVKQRAAVETAGASIGLSRARLLLDRFGTCRGEQLYLVDNRTEQFLVVNIPDGMSLWAAKVAGETVKPIVAEPDRPQVVSIPLVKTAEGDLDYEVVLIYGGSPKAPAFPRRFDFPLIRTVNINVEQSQVEVLLPRELTWFRFAGTMRKLEDAGEFEAGFLAYQNRLAKRLVQTLQSDNLYGRQRAYSNLKILSSQMKQSRDDLTRFAGNTEVSEQIALSDTILTDAQRQLDGAGEATAATGTANDARIRNFFQVQQAELTGEGVLKAGANWDMSGPAPDAPGLPEGQVAKESELLLNRGWLEANAFVQDKKAPADEQEPQVESKPATRIVVGKAAAPTQQKDDRERLSFRRGREPAKPEQQAPAPQVAPPPERPAPPVNAPVVVTATHAAQAAPTGLASLDIRLPDGDSQRWQSTRFTTPRGNVELTAYAMPATIPDAAQRLALAIVTVLVIVVPAWRFASGKRLGGNPAVWSTVGLCAGLLSLLIGIFPVVGAVVLLASIVNKVFRFAARLLGRSRVAA